MHNEGVAKGDYKNTFAKQIPQKARRNAAVGVPQIFGCSMPHYGAVFSFSCSIHFCTISSTSNETDHFLLSAIFVRIFFVSAFVRKEMNSVFFIFITCVHGISFILITLDIQGILCIST